MANRKSFLTIVFILVLIAFVSLAMKKENPSLKQAVEKVSEIYMRDVMYFDSLLVEYPKYFNDSSYEMRLNKYDELTKNLKKIEWLFTYYHRDLSYSSFFHIAQFVKRDFGPPFPDNWIIAGPFGIEPDSVLQQNAGRDGGLTKKFITRAVVNFRNVLKQSNYLQDAEHMNASEIFDALRLQMVRISTVGISNSDFVIEQAGMPALEGAYESWVKMVKIFADRLTASQNILKEKINQTVAKGQMMLDKKPGFRNFDRMTFLTDVLIPLSRQLYQMQEALEIEFVKKPSAFYASAKHIYDRNVFNPDYFAPGSEAKLTEARAELGKFLFFDPALSDNNERACASCHKPELAFTDGNVKSLDFKRGDLPRNAPTVINAVFQKFQFWDLRATSLEDQLDSVINSPDEMHSSFEDVIEKVTSSKEYRELFYAAFPETRSSGIQRKHVKVAIASYERMLTGMDSRFDQYVRGDKTKMDEEEINGFNIFMGKGKCGTCHYAPLFNGSQPPYFDFVDHRSIGVPVKDTMEVYRVDPDTGASKTSGNPFLHFSFKVPTARNVELTAPYMHNGVYKTLEQVVEFYNHAGGHKFTKDMRPGMKGLPFFMILPDTLGLTEPEKADIVKFLKTLTDNSASQNIPHRLPKLEGKFEVLNDRVVGGVY